MNDAFKGLADLIGGKGAQPSSDEDKIKKWAETVLDAEGTAQRSKIELLLNGINGNLDEKIRKKLADQFPGASPEDLKRVFELLKRREGIGELVAELGFEPDTLENQEAKMRRLMRFFQSKKGAILGGAALLSKLPILFEQLTQDDLVESGDLEGATRDDLVDILDRLLEKRRATVIKYAEENEIDLSSFLELEMSGEKASEEESDAKTETLSGQKIRELSASLQAMMNNLHRKVNSAQAIARMESQINDIEKGARGDERLANELEKARVAVATSKKKQEDFEALLGMDENDESFLATIEHLKEVVISGSVPPKESHQTLEDYFSLYTALMDTKAGGAETKNGRLKEAAEAILSAILDGNTRIIGKIETISRETELSKLSQANRELVVNRYPGFFIPNDFVELNNLVKVMQEKADETKGKEKEVLSQKHHLDSSISDASIRREAQEIRREVEAERQKNGWNKAERKMHDIITNIRSFIRASRNEPSFKLRDYLAKERAEYYEGYEEGDFIALLKALDKWHDSPTESGEMERPSAEAIDNFASQINSLANNESAENYHRMILDAAHFMSHFAGARLPAGIEDVCVKNFMGWKAPDDFATLMEKINVEPEKLQAMIRIQKRLRGIEKRLSKLEAKPNRQKVEAIIDEIRTLDISELAKEQLIEAAQEEIDLKKSPVPTSPTETLSDGKTQIDTSDKGDIMDPKKTEKKPKTTDSDFDITGFPEKDQELYEQLSQLLEGETDPKYAALLQTTMVNINAKTENDRHKRRQKMARARLIEIRDITDEAAKKQELKTELDDDDKLNDTTVELLNALAPKYNS